jgi:TM2 domain-containing membrane protein YozV
MQPTDPQQPLTAPLRGSDKKLRAGLCGIFLGALGVHKFVLGYTNTGIIMLATTLAGGLLSKGIIAGLVGIVGLIEGIIYLTKPDEQFVQQYVLNKKFWF